MPFLSRLSRRVQRAAGRQPTREQEFERLRELGGYGRIWAPTDESEAMDLILSNRDPELFEAAGRYDAENVLGPMIGPEDVVLDLGCGIGRVARYVAPLCRELWAVDASEAMLKMARERLADRPNVRFAQSSDTSLPDVPDGSIDFAYSLLTLQHVEREHAFLLLREIRRILRPDGSAHLTFPNLLSDRYLQDFITYAESGEAGNPARARFYTPQEVERILPAAGFAIRELDADVEIRVSCHPGGALS
jgi:ubiquinone/menaquinone biosynthesis C-methylase UbiE